MAAKVTINDIISHSRECVRRSPSAATLEAVKRYAAIFDSACESGRDSQLNLFTFHVDVPESHRQINYVDVKHDHWTFDYRKLASHFVWAGSMFNRNVRM